MSRTSAPRSALHAAIHACLPQLRAVAVFSLVLNLLYIAPTIYMLQIYDRVVPTRGALTLIFLTIVLVVSLAAMSTLDLLRSRILVRTSNRLEQLVAPKIVSAMLNRPDPGRASDVLREFDQMRAIIAGPGTLAVLDAPWTPIYILLGWLIHPALGLMAMVGSATLLAVALANERSVKLSVQHASMAGAAAYADLDQALAVRETILGLGMAPALAERHLADRNTVNQLQMPSGFQSASYLATTKFLRQLIQSLALGLGAYLALRGSISAGAIFAASLLVTRALAPIELIVGNWRNIIHARSAWSHIGELIEGDVASPRTALPEAKGRVVIENAVVRGGSGNQLILAGINLTIEPGQSLGIVGSSGAGKTTLARMIVGAGRLTSGTIRVDGAELHSLDSQQRSHTIGYAPQQPDLLAGTVKDNISRFDRTSLIDQALVDDEVLQAATLSGAHDMILYLPEGYNTPLGRRGVGLSAGQAARISLARAFYRSPRLVVLDEPNAALDADGEAALVQALQRLKERSVTQVIVAHRAAVLTAVDLLLVLRAGKVELFGPRDEVIARMMTNQPNGSVKAGAGRRA